MIKEYDVIVATKDISKKISKGIKGAVLMIFEDPEGYLIEFVDREGETIEIEDVKPDEIELVESY